MERIKKYFTEVHPAINILAIASLIVSFGYEMWLSKIPEVVSWGAEVSVFFNQVSIAIFSSYIFYIIVVRKKEVDDWENIKPIVSDRVQQLISIYNHQVKTFEQESGLPIDPNSYQSVAEALKKIKPLKLTSPKININNGSRHNWYVSIVIDQNNMEDILNNLFNISHHLDTELLAILNTLSKLSLKQRITLFSNNISSNSIGWLGGDFHSYFETCEILKQYQKAFLLNGSSLGMN